MLSFYLIDNLSFNKFNFYAQNYMKSHKIGKFLFFD